jgi:hypothetical protein
LISGLGQMAQRDRGGRGCGGGRGTPAVGAPPPTTEAVMAAKIE